MSTGSRNMMPTGCPSNKQKGPSPSSASALTPKNKMEHYWKNSKVKPAYSKGSVKQGGNKPPACAKCGKNHFGVCPEGSTSCFKCTQMGHFMRESPKNKQGSGNGGNITQYSSVAPTGRVSPRGASSGTGGGTNCLQALNNLQE